MSDQELVHAPSSSGLADAQKTALPLAPIARRVTRYRCPCCRRGYSSRSTAVRHIGWCSHNPANRSCMTCEFFEPGERADLLGFYPGSPRMCGEGCFLEDGLPRQCPKWASSDEPQKSAHGTARKPNTSNYSPNQHHPSPSASAGGDGEEHQRD